MCVAVPQAGQHRRDPIDPRSWRDGCSSGRSGVRNRGPIEHNAPVVYWLAAARDEYVRFDAFHGTPLRDRRSCFGDTVNRRPSPPSEGFESPHPADRGPFLSRHLDSRLAERIEPVNVTIGDRFARPSAACVIRRWVIPPMANAHPLVGLGPSPTCGGLPSCCFAVTPVLIALSAFGLARKLLRRAFGTHWCTSSPQIRARVSSRLQPSVGHPTS